jgi:hypothetical protein
VLYVFVVDDGGTVVEVDACGTVVVGLDVWAIVVEVVEEVGGGVGEVVDEPPEKAPNGVVVVWSTTGTPPDATTIGDGDPSAVGASVTCDRTLPIPAAPIRIATIVAPAHAAANPASRFMIHSLPRLGSYCVNRRLTSPHRTGNQTVVSRSLGIVAS